MSGAARPGARRHGRGRDLFRGGLQIGNPWARATPSGASVGAGYLTITNKGREPDRLVGGSAAPASRFEVHATVMEQGVAKMRPVEGARDQARRDGRTQARRHARDVHGAQAAAQQGQRVKGTLVFEKAGTVEIEFAVQAVGAPAPGGHGHTGHLATLLDVRVALNAIASRLRMTKSLPSNTNSLRRWAV